MLPYSQLRITIVAKEIIKDGKQPCERKALAPCAITQGYDLPLAQRKCWTIGRQPLLSGPTQITAATTTTAAASNSKSVTNPRRIGLGVITPYLLSCRKNGAASSSSITGGKGQQKVLPPPPLAPLSLPDPGVSSQADLNVGPRNAQTRLTAVMPRSSPKKSSALG